MAESVGIEVKARTLTSQRDYKGLLALGEDLKMKRKIVVALERERRRTEHGIDNFLRELWAGEIV